MMGFASLYPSYGIKTAAAPAPLSGTRETPRRRRSNLDIAARGLDFPEALPGNEALDFALD
jgi:hypothetical protein